MSQQQIGQGPGNLVADVEFRQFIANGAIAKGDVLAFYGTTGYTVDQCSATTVPIGVAAEAAADGAWFSVQISGHCDNVTNDGTDIVAGDLLYAGAAGVCLGITAGDDQGVTVGRIFGIALQSDAGTTCSNVQLLKMI